MQLCREIKRMIFMRKNNEKFKQIRIVEKSIIAFARGRQDAFD